MLPAVESVGWWNSPHISVTVCTHPRHQRTDYRLSHPCCNPMFFKQNMSSTRLFKIFFPCRLQVVSVRHTLITHKCAFLVGTLCLSRRSNLYGEMPVSNWLSICFTSITTRIEKDEPTLKLIVVSRVGNTSICWSKPDKCKTLPFPLISFNPKMEELENLEPSITSDEFVP